MLNAGLTVTDLAGQAGVDPKTCERWITKGRTPHRLNARKAAEAVGEDVAYLWPETGQGLRHRGMHPDLVAIYASRADTPLQTWRALFEQAGHDIGVLVYAALFLHEMWPDFGKLLAARAAAGCQVRVLLGDPDGQMIARRGQEEKYGHGIESRCRQALLHYAPLAGTPGIGIRLHDTPLYNSVYRGDDQMIVNTHRFGINAYATPVLHLRRSAPDGLFDGYAESFDDVWKLGRPAEGDARGAA
jgi:hypothetical protein